MSTTKRIVIIAAIFVAAAIKLFALAVSGLMFMLFAMSNREHEITSAVSPDGNYSVTVIEIGSPAFYSPNDCRAVLYEKGSKVSTVDFEVANDGGNIYPSNFSVEWEKERAVVTADGSEQSPESHSLYYGG